VAEDSGRWVAAEDTFPASGQVYRSTWALTSNHPKYAQKEVSPSTAPIMSLKKGKFNLPTFVCWFFVGVGETSPGGVAPPTYTICYCYLLDSPGEFILIPLFAGKFEFPLDLQSYFQESENSIA